jgi:hypothetical protein
MGASLRLCPSHRFLVAKRLHVGRVKYKVF